MAISSLKRAVFLDKDGTLIQNLPYNTDQNRISFYQDVTEGLKQLKKAGYQLIMVSNQSGVARGMFNERDAEKALDYVKDKLKLTGVTLDDYFYCPHHPRAAVEEYRQICDCRKPLPGMLLKAAKKHDIDLEESWMIGDILDDVEAGNRAHCRSLLIDNGNETEWLQGLYRTPWRRVSSFSEAVNNILDKEKT